IRGGSHAPHHLARSRESQPVRVDRLDVLPREVVGPDLDVVELREVGGEERADRAAADDTNPQDVPPVAARVSRRCRRPGRGSRTSLPPVMPDGRRTRMIAISAPRTTRLAPSGTSNEMPSAFTPSSAFTRTESGPVTSRAPA